MPTRIFYRTLDLQLRFIMKNEIAYTNLHLNFNVCHLMKLNYLKLLKSICVFLGRGLTVQSR